MIRKLGRTKKLGISILSLGLADKAYEVYDESYMFSRMLRTIKCGLHILYAYKIAFDEHNYLEIHESVAKDIY